MKAVGEVGAEGEEAVEAGVLREPQLKAVGEAGEGVEFWLGIFAVPDFWMIFRVTFESGFSGEFSTLGEFPRRGGFPASGEF